MLLLINIYKNGKIITFLEAENSDDNDKKID